MYALAVNVVKRINRSEYESMVHKANKHFKQAKLSGVRYKGKPTAKTWNKYEVY